MAGAHDHRQAIEREGLPALLGREGVGQDRLLGLGASPPPPAPCSTRQKIRIGSDGASPHIADEMPKSTTQIM